MWLQFRTKYDLYQEFEYRGSKAMVVSVHIDYCIDRKRQIAYGFTYDNGNGFMKVTEQELTRIIKNGKL